MSQIVEKGIPGNQLPHDLEAERAILGAVLLDNSLLAQVNERLNAGDFFLDGHRSILQFMNDLARDGIRIDRANLTASLTACRLPFERSGFTTLMAFVEGVPRLGNIEPFIRAVKRKAQERELICWLDRAHSGVANGEGYEKMIADAERFFTHFNRLTVQGIKGVYPSLADFFNADIREPEEIIAGLRRGEVAELAAVTNQGKSTLLLNLGLSLAAGQAYAPLLPEISTARRVVYLDCESPASRLWSDLQVMFRKIIEPQTAGTNFIPIVDAEIDGVPLNLRREAHLQYIEAAAKDWQADLLVIDTVSSAFELLNENDNAEITRRVMNPLKLLARRLNCAIIFAHHIGKMNENQTGERAYRGRGGSALGGLASTVYTMENDSKHDKGYSVLTCAKSKGEIPAPALIRLDFESRWFALCDERPEPKSKMPTVQEIVEFVAAQGAAYTEEILNYFADRASTRRIADRLSEAGRLRLIWKINKQSPWRICPPEIAAHPGQDITIVYTGVKENLQSDAPIVMADCQIQGLAEEE